MKALGLWNEEEIAASYTPSRATIVVIICLILLGFLAVGLWGGQKRRQLCALLGAAVIAAYCFVWVVYHLAAALCIAIPLNVQVHGLLNVPFFLGTRDLGILLLAALFVITNGMAIALNRDYLKRIQRMVTLNAALAAILIAAVLAAYAAVRMGVGVPLG